MRKLIYSVATTLDGFIAQTDGSFNHFIMEGDHVTDFQASLATFDTVLMGRKTYEVGLSLGVTSPYPMMRQYVFSRTMEQSLDEQVTLISETPEDFVRGLKTGNGQDIWLCGGGHLAGVLLNEGLIDEVVLKVNPILFGSGIPLFGKEATPVNLGLVDSKVYNNGVILLSYQVEYES